MTVTRTGGAALRSLGKALAALAALPGCLLGPDYRRPETASVAALGPASPIEAGEAGPRITSAPPRDRWWEVFQDAELDRLVGEALAWNGDLRAAVARVHIARSLVRQAFSPLLPAVGVGVEYTYQKASENAFSFAGGGAGGGSPGAAGGFDASGDPFDLFAGAADAGYELDLWGRLRRGLEAARGEEAAVDEDRKTVEITLIADLAETYFDLGRAEAEVELARETAELRERTLELVRGRVDAGLSGEVELRRAEGELAAARGLLPEAERLRALAEHRLSVLTGRPPDLRRSGKPPAAFALPPEVPVGIPSSLLERRPDLRAAERRLAASNARIGAARADLFPRVTIAGRLGYASLDAGTVARGASQLWALGPSVRLPVFQGGLLRARVYEAQARAGEAEARYRQAVLRAFGEVADAIAAIAARSRARDHDREAARAAELAVELATVGYREGLADFLGVLDAQSALLAARRALLESERGLLGSLVALHRALGGGFGEGPAVAGTPAL